MRTAAKRLIYIGLAVLVVGCSSGGGSDSPITSLPLAEIDSQNAPIIAGAVTKAAFEGSDLSEFAGLAGGGAILSAPDGQVFAKIGGIQSSQMQSVRDRVLVGDLQGPIPPETTDCAISGTVTVSGNIANALTLSANDTFTLVFTSCDDGEGVINGTYAMRISSFTGDLLSGSFSLSTSVTLSGFSIVADAQTAIVTGDISISMTASDSPTQTVSISSTSLTVSDGVNSHTLASYTATQMVDQFTSAYTLNVSGTLSSSTFSGRVTFMTSADLAGDGVGFAFQGEIRVTGAQNATIWIIILDAELLRLDIDFDNDGIIDEIVDTTWAELLAQP